MKQLLAGRGDLKFIAVDGLQSLTSIEDIADDRLEEAPPAKLSNSKARTFPILNDEVTGINHWLLVRLEGAGVVEDIQANCHEEHRHEPDRPNSSPDNGVAEKDAHCHRHDDPNRDRRQPIESGPRRVPVCER